MKVPDPPPGSSFTADMDKQGQPRLSWSLRPNYFGAVLAIAVFGCWLYLGVRLLIQDLAGRPSPEHVFGDLTQIFFVGAIFIVLVYAVGRTLIYGPPIQR